MDKFEATFDAYWNSPEFETYDPDRDRDRLDDALLEAKGSKSSDRVTISLSGLEVRPYPYQQEMLDAIEVERVAPRSTSQSRRRRHGHRQDGHRRPGLPPTWSHRPAASSRACSSLRTGRRSSSSRCARIERSWRTATSASCTSAAQRPERWKHVFASVQSLTSYGVANIPRDAYEIVVIDEFHHAEAQTYRRILDHLQPRELLGLTATPERADGTDVRSLLRRPDRSRASAVGRARR